MPTDRESLSLYETPEARKWYEQHGWPEWVNGQGRRCHLIFTGHDLWVEEAFEDGEWGMHYRRVVDDHPPFCVLRDHARVTLEKRWACVHTTAGPAHCSISLWADAGAPAPTHVIIAVTYDAALLAGLAAKENHDEAG